MLQKIIGAILLIIGGLGSLVLLTYGGPVFPHLVGPATLLAVGGGLLVWQRGKK